MKTLIIIGALIMSTFSSSGQAAQKNNESHLYTEIHTTDLKAWYDSGKTMYIVDARSKPYYDGTLLPQAVWLPYDASAKDVNMTLPNKNSVIVVYCWSPQCPASQYLIDRLTTEGYTNLYKYPEGLQDWMQRGLPTTKG